MGIVGTPQWSPPARPTRRTCSANRPWPTRSSAWRSRCRATDRRRNRRLLVLEAVNDKTGEVEKRWTPPAVDVSGGQAMLATDLDWENPKLWWPDEPNCYRLRITVQVDGQPADVQRDAVRLPPVDARRHSPAAERRQVAGLHRARRARHHAGGASGLAEEPEVQLRLQPHVAAARRAVQVAGPGAGGSARVHGPRRRADPPHRLPGRRSGRLSARTSSRNSARTGSTISRPGSKANATTPAS